MAATVSDKGKPAAATMMLPTLELKEKDKEDDSANLGSPFPKSCCLIPNLRVARSMNFFNTQLTPNYMGWLVQATNCRAVADGAGSGTYPDFVPFDLPELYKFVGLLFANGLTQSPSLNTGSRGKGKSCSLAMTSMHVRWISMCVRVIRSARSIAGNTSGDTSPCQTSVTIQRERKKSIPKLYLPATVPVAARSTGCPN